MCTRMRTYYSSEIGVDTYFVEMLMNSRNQLKKRKKKKEKKKENQEKNYKNSQKIDLRGRAWELALLQRNVKQKRSNKELKGRF